LLNKFAGALKTLSPLAKRISAEDWAGLQELCKGKAEGAEDEPAPFPGRPRPGGRVDAMDHALAFNRKHKAATSTPKSFDAMYGNTSVKPSDSNVAKSLSKLIGAVGTDPWPGQGRTRG
jgi:hypothetical protein